MDSLARTAINRAQAALNVAMDRPRDDQRSIVTAEPDTRPVALGMSRRELESYSLARALNDLSRGIKRGLEGEISDELHRIHSAPNESSNYLLVPPDPLRHAIREHTIAMLQRDLTVASAAGGGYLVGTDGGASYIDAVRNRSVAFVLGATGLPHQAGNVILPRQSATATGYFLGNEGTGPTESQPSFGQIALAPKVCGAYVEFSRQLLLQSNPRVDGIIANDLLRTLATLIDLAALTGTGSAGQPVGILNTSGIGGVTGTSLGLAGICEFQTDVGEALSELDGFATTSAVASLLAQRQKASGTSSFLWEGSLRRGALNGVRAMSSAQVPAATMIYGGDWSRLMIASWGALQVEINPYADFKAGTVGARVLHAIDTGVTVPSAFSVATSVT